MQLHSDHRCALRVSQAVRNQNALALLEFAALKGTGPSCTQAPVLLQGPPTRVTGHVHVNTFGVGGVAQLKRRP